MQTRSQYRTRDIADRCGISTGDVANILRIARQTGQYDRHNLRGGNGSPYLISQRVYDDLFSGIERAYRQVQTAELEAKRQELAGMLNQKEAAVLERVVRAGAQRTDNERLAEARSRRAFKFHRRGGSHMRLAASYQRRDRRQP